MGFYVLCLIVGIFCIFNEYEPGIAVPLVIVGIIGTIYCFAEENNKSHKNTSQNKSTTKTFSHISNTNNTFNNNNQNKSASKVTSNMSTPKITPNKVAKKVNTTDGANIVYKPQKNDEVDYEEYVEVRFNNYYRTYTYLAPIGRLLKAGDRINIVTNDGIKSVTVVKGNYKCLKKTDMIYKRINIR